MARVIPSRLPEAARRPAGGNGHPAPPPGLGGRDGPGWGAEPSPVATARVGLWILLVAVTMLFIAFTVSYLSRRSAPDWTAVPLPGILWLNTVVLVASSAVLAWTRRTHRHLGGKALRRGLLQAGGLGLLFLLGQIAAWRALATAGVFMSSSPYSAFFYLLTAVHGLHLLGGLGGLGYALSRSSLPAAAAQPVPAVEGATLFWHFLAALWVSLLIIISI